MNCRVQGLPFVLSQDRSTGRLRHLSIEVREPEQPPRDHAHEREIWFQALSVLQAAVFDGTARLEHLMKRLDSWPHAIPPA
jgi:hypothetical protein